VSVCVKSHYCCAEIETEVGNEEMDRRDPCRTK
jgi:hypothetical protein